jgi:hypothetical protein
MTIALGLDRSTPTAHGAVIGGVGPKGGSCDATMSCELGAADPTWRDTIPPAIGNVIKSRGGFAPHPPPRLLTIGGKHGFGSPSKVMIWMHVDTLLQSSVAVQVRVRVALVGLGIGWVEQVPTCTSVNVTAGFGSQLSVAVAEPVADGTVELPQGTVMSGGHVIAGGTLSFTVIAWVHVLVLPQASVA